MSKKAKRRINFFECKEDILQRDFIRGAHIELFSNREITVEGCTGVLEYSNDYIKLNLGKGALILCGQSLDVLFFENDTITVRGKISSIEFCI